MGCSSSQSLSRFGATCPYNAEGARTSAPISANASCSLSERGALPNSCVGEFVGASLLANLWDSRELAPRKGVEQSLICCSARHAPETMPAPTFITSAQPRFAPAPASAAK